MIKKAEIVHTYFIVVLIVRIGRESLMSGAGESMILVVVFLDARIHFHCSRVHTIATVPVRIGHVGVDAVELESSSGHANGNDRVTARALFCHTAFHPKRLSASSLSSFYPKLEPMAAPAKNNSKLEEYIEKYCICVRIFFFISPINHHPFTD